MRLDKYLASCGIGSRKEVKDLIKGKRVLVNGILAKDGKQQLAEHQDEVLVDGEKINYQTFVYYMLHKPQGVLSATEDRSQPTVLDLLGAKDWRGDIFPVGRLDKDTEGLLLLTNDGQLAHELLAPKKHVTKEYLLHAVGEIDENAQQIFEAGILLKNGEKCQPAVLQFVEKTSDYTVWQVEIHEGKYHQVKRMIAAVGGRVVYLKRLGMGTLRLDEGLSIGEYRALTDEEIAGLKNNL